MKHSSVIELYQSRAVKIVMTLAALTAVAVGAVFTCLWLLGYYPLVSPAALILFVLSCAFLFAAGSFLKRQCQDETDRLRPDVYRKAVIYLLAEAVLLWNFLSYLFPGRELWAYVLCFALLPALLLNSRVLLASMAALLFSLFVSWILRPEALLPVMDENLIPGITQRVVCLLSGCILLWLLIRLLEKHLIPEMERIAEYDPLTLLRNRRTLEDTAGEMIRRASLSGGSFTALMCDLDDFKTVNDTYGHKCGDRVLQHVSDLLRKNLGEADTAFRYGGEELLVLVDAEEEKALRTAEAIRQDIATDAILQDGQPVPVTITIGAAAYKQKDTLDDLIRIADERLYYGKKNGKNQVVSEQTR